MASEPFLSEIQIFAFNFNPRGWLLCNGAILPINQNQALYSLLGTTYGGDGRTTFGIPNLQGRVPMHIDAFFPQGQTGGQESHTLSVQEMAAHTHTVNSSTATVSQPSPGGNLWAKGAQAGGYSSTANAAMNAAATGNTGGGQAHENRMPYQTLNICIATQGIFPSRN